MAQHSSSTCKKAENSQVADLCGATILGEFAALNLIEESINNLTQNIYDTASEALGNAGKKDEIMVDQQHSGSAWHEKKPQGKKIRWPRGKAKLKWSRPRNRKKNGPRKRKLDHKPMTRIWSWNQYRKDEGGSRAAFNTLKLLTRRQQAKTELGPLIENKKGKVSTEEKAIHKRWTDWSMELCNYKLKTDASLLKNEDKIENRETGQRAILKQEEEKAARMLKKGKSPGVENFPSRFQSMEDQTNGWTSVVCQKTWTNGQLPKDWTQSKKATWDFAWTT